ncbi:MAG: multicopper oxidase domain-containing protein [Bacteroidetes bacterium]|nr:multicopper oxidase domain-containing protein [Bacteroidota bacterium]
MRTSLIALLLLMGISVFGQKVVRYDLYVTDTTVNYTGHKKHALAINGSIPGPSLIFTEGDTAEVYVHNKLKEETSIHWHGLIIPNGYDGVPYLTNAPIKPGETYLYRFPLVQNGTYWYHSHSGMQEQSGLYGALIIHKREEHPMKEYTMLISDWTNENPDEVHRSLYAATDWYGIRKKATQDYLESLKERQFKTKITNEWKRLSAMDVSDVYYDKFLINGSPETNAPEFKGGDTVRLRVINGSSSTYFWLRYAGGKITVIASDGKDVEPVPVDRMIIGVSETYDVTVIVPSDSSSFEFTATPEDRTKQASLWIGTGTKHAIKPMPKLKYFEGMKMMNDMTNMASNIKMGMMSMSNQQMDMNTVMYPEVSGAAKKHRRKKGMVMDTTSLEPITTLNYSMLRSPEKTTLPDAPVKTLKFTLTGNMNRYVWTIDNKTVSESDKILIKHSENVRIILVNASMMRHPMHLHGHFFRLLNGQGEYAPLKNVVDIMPMEVDTIEFAATESGDWFFHCHILYHMMSGMGRIFSYENSPPNPELPNPKRALRKLYWDDRKPHVMAELDAASNGIDGEFMVSNTRWFGQAEWRLGYSLMDGFETETHIGRYFGKNQFLRVYAGGDFRYREGRAPEKNLFQQADTKNKRFVACIGVQYVLPLLIVADLRVDHTGNVRFQLMREDIPLTRRLRMGFMVNTDFEYMVGLKYIVHKYLAISTHYDSDMKWGAGLTVRY